MSDDAPFTQTALAAIERLVHQRFDSGLLRTESIPHGLGSRRFFRVHLAPHAMPSDTLPADRIPQTLIARVDRDEDPALRPEGIPPEPALEPLRSVLEAAGLPVPRCFATKGGLTLLEDVGDRSLEAAVEAGLPPHDVALLYRRACSYLPVLQSLAPRGDVPAFARRLDDALFRYKAEQVISWTLPWAHRARAARASEAQAVREAFGFIAQSCRDAPMRLAHRDFKAANLHVCHPDGEEGQRTVASSRLVMIDIQGAFLAPPEYDLVCLLRDSHVALPEHLVEQLQSEVRIALPDAPDAETFYRRFTLLTLTRNGKDLSRYLYAARERNDRRYERLLPRAVSTLKAAALAAAGWHPTLARLADVIASIPDPE